MKMNQGRKEGTGGWKVHWCIQLTRNSFNFKINYTHALYFMWLQSHCDARHLQHHLSVCLFPSFHIHCALSPPPPPTKLNPKNLHISPSKITTHFGSHSNHSIPYHITYKSRHSYHFPIPKKHFPIQSSRNPEMYSRGWLFLCEIRQRFFSSSSSSSHDTALWWCFVFHPSLRSHLNFLRLLFSLSIQTPNPTTHPPTKTLPFALYQRVHHPRNAFCVWNYSYYC